jgi:hypothetical protein
MHFQTQWGILATWGLFVGPVFAAIRRSQWGDVPTWGLFVGAVFTAIYARLAFRKQSEEVKLLGQQLSDQQAINKKQADVADLQAQELRESIDQRKREATDRQMAQARLVAAWLDAFLQDALPFPELVIRIRNGSGLPVYRVIMNINVGVRGRFVRQPGALGPGETRELRVAIPGYPRIDVRPDIMFIDSQGRQWLRRGYRGEITEASMQDSIDIVATNPGAYTSYEDHPTMSLPTSPEQDRGQRVD